MWYGNSELFLVALPPVAGNRLVKGDLRVSLNSFFLSSIINGVFCLQRGFSV